MVERRREDSELQLAGEAKGVKWAVPVPAKRNVVEIYNKTLEAAGAYDVSLPEDVWKSRAVHLFIEVTPQGAGNQVSIIPEVNNNADPLEDTWYPIGVTDGAVTVSPLTSPSTHYDGEAFGLMEFVPLAIQTPESTGTGILCMLVTIDVSAAKFVRFRVAERGVAGDPSDLVLNLSKSI